MNYSDTENYGNRTDEDLLEAAMPLLQALGPALHAAVLQVAHANHLTPAQAKLLLQLSTHGQMTMGEIAAGLCVSMPAASELVDRLVDAGHLVRDVDPSDRRRVLIAPTPEARRIGTHFCDLRRSRLRYALEKLAPEERPVFVRSLAVLLAGLTHDVQDGSMPCLRSDAAVGNTVSADQLPRAAATAPKVGSDHESSHADANSAMASRSRGINR